MKKSPNHILSTITVLFISTLVSCSSSVTDQTIDYSSFLQGFEYTAGDDAPYEYNCIEGGDQLQQSDGVLYFFDGFPIEQNKTLCKLTPETGLVSAVCSDPLCGHSSPDCKLFGATNHFYIYNNKVFFKRIYSYTYRNPDGTARSRSEVSDSVFYDMESAKLKVLESYDSKSSVDFTRQLFYKNYRYYYDYVYDETADRHIFRMCRLNIDSGETSVIGGDNNIDEVSDRFVFVLNDRIFFTDGRSLYSKSIDNNDKKLHCTGKFDDIVCTDGQNVYFDLYNNGLRDVYVLPDVDDYTSAKLIIEGCTNWKLTKNFIYYVDGDKRIIGKSNVSGYQGDDVVFYGRQIQRCQHNGENTEAVFTYDGEYSNYQLTNIVILGNYIYGTYQYWEDSDKDGILQDDDIHYSNKKGDYSIMRINVSSGDVYIIKQ